jgi:hypothetical protein
MRRIMAERRCWKHCRMESQKEALSHATPSNLVVHSEFSMTVLPVCNFVTEKSAWWSSPWPLFWSPTVVLVEIFQYRAPCTEYSNSLWLSLQVDASLLSNFSLQVLYVIPPSYVSHTPPTFFTFALWAARRDLQSTLLRSNQSHSQYIRTMPRVYNQQGTVLVRCEKLLQLTQLYHPNCLIWQLAKLLLSFWNFWNNLC